MADFVRKEVRSQIMAKIKAKGNKSTEQSLRMFFVRNGIKGWSLQPKNVVGNPDFSFPQAKIAVFVDGCFWHGCPKCGHIPKSNSEYWNKKISKTKMRDKENRALLKKEGWEVIGFWEHELSDFNYISKMLIRSDSVFEKLYLRTGIRD